MTFIGEVLLSNKSFKSAYWKRKWKKLTNKLEINLIWGQAWNTQKLMITLNCADLPVMDSCSLSRHMDAKILFVSNLLECTSMREHIHQRKGDLFISLLWIQNSFKFRPRALEKSLWKLFLNILFRWKSCKKKMIIYLHTSLNSRHRT